MKRRLINLTAASSLLLCAVTIVMWVRSYSVSDAWLWGSPREQWGLIWDSGTVSLLHAVNLDFPDWATWWGEPPGYRRWGIAHERHVPWQPNPHPWLPNIRVLRWAQHRETDLFLPCWLIVVATALLPITWAILNRTARRRRRWHLAARCQMCGYDLRASTSRCPECGTPIGSTERAAR